MLGAMAGVRMDNVLLVVEDLEGVIEFFEALGLEVEGRATVEGPDVDRLVALEGVRSDIVSLRAPGGGSTIELDHFQTPPAVRLEPADAPVHALGYRRIMFEVDDIEPVLQRLLDHGGELVGEVVQYGSTNRLCYVRGPEGIMVALAQTLG